MNAALATARSAFAHPQFRQGAADVSGLAIGIAAWGLVTGVAMVKGGLGLWLSLLMTLVVYAGSAQLSVIPLLGAGAPLWVVWLTATCVNLRFVIFSSMWRAYFGHLPLARRLTIGYFSGDVIYVAFLKRFPQPEPRPGQQAYFWGAASLNWFAWQSASIAGIVLANQIPLEWGLGFAGVLALLGVTLSLLVNRNTVIACVVAGSAAVAAFALPLKLNILVAIAAAVVVGLVLEQIDSLRKPSAEAA